MDGQVAAIRLRSTPPGMPMWGSSPTRRSTPLRSTGLSAMPWTSRSRGVATARVISRTRGTGARHSRRPAWTWRRARTSSWSSLRSTYLDVIAAVRAAVDVPVAAYNVSGEYAMVVAAAERGWIDRQAVAARTPRCDKAGRRGPDPHLLRRRGRRGARWLRARRESGSTPAGAAQSCSLRPAGSSPAVSTLR